MRREFFEMAGQPIRLLIDTMESLPETAVTIKNAEGRIIHTNPYNAAISGWKSREDMIGYTPEELYPPDQAAVYAGRDREVMETGKPIIDRIYGFVADRSTNLHCVSVRPVIGTNGRLIGTCTVYYRAQRRMKTRNWYDPIRKAVVYLNDHYAEKVSIQKLASISHYSVAQFRKLFHEMTQASPSEYIAQVRINAAKTMLTTTDKLIIDIAVETGFFDHSHFIRTFRRLTGLTPAKYRRQHLP
ncbi:MAG: AraC family transcriptional regulator [Kiritimatiellia bacterium]